jgi:Asp-tRNA(Asn)/Glu-tRNA(Gln) amidotransferase A subunit family amidase
MIKLPVERPYDFTNVERDLNAIKAFPDLIRYYEELVENYQALDSKYFFSECFDRNFIFKQLEEKFSMRERGLFAIPFGVKDVFNTLVLPTTMGSEIWRDFKAGNNARLVDEIADRGGIVFSKTTTAEFAVHYIQDGKTLNPHNSNHITGTSSAGSAVAVACGALPIGLGTQTAGSIVRPASFCGVYGFKPSFGAIDRTGVLKTADTLDTLGFLGSDIYGIKKTFISTFQKEVENYYNARNYFSAYKSFQQKNKIRVGIISNQFFGYEDYDDYIKEDFEELITRLSNNDINFEIVSDVDFINEIHPLHESIYCKSLSYYFQEEFARGSGMSNIMSEMIERGKKIPTQEFINALNQQPKYRSRFDAIIKNYDFLITPSTASVAPKVGERERDDTCLIWTFLGYPVLSIPSFWSNEFGLPYGIQIIAPRYFDFSLFDFGQLIVKSCE